MDQRARCSGLEKRGRSPAARRRAIDADCCPGGGGRHLFYAYNAAPVVYKPGKGIEIKSDGGYVAVAPSLHASGKRYVWRERPRRGLQLSDVPPWALGVGLHTGTGQHKAPIDPKRVLRQGERDNELIRIAGQQRRLGYGEAEIYALLSTHNRMYCEPPKPDVDVKRIAHSAMRWEPEPKAVDDPTSQAQKHTVEVLTARQLLAWKGDPQEYHINPLVPNEGLGVLVADSGSFKTWSLIDMAFAMGNKCKTWQDMRIDNPGRTLVIESELPKSELQRRVRRLLDGSNGRYKDIGVDFVQERFDVHTPGSFELLLKVILRRKYALVIGDSLSKFHVGNESDPSFMTKTMVALRTAEENVRRVHGEPCMFLVAHHMRKFSADGSNTIGQRSRGASSIKDNSATMFGLSRQRSGKSKLIHEKNWIGQERGPLLIWPEDVNYGGKIGVSLKSGPVVDDKEEQAMTKPQAAEAYLMIFLGSHAGETLSRQDIEAAITEHGIGTRTTQNTIREAEEHGLIVRERQGRGGAIFYHVSDDDSNLETLYENE